MFTDTTFNIICNSSANKQPTCMQEDPYYIEAWAANVQDMFIKVLAMTIWNRWESNHVFRQSWMSTTLSCNAYYCWVLHQEPGVWSETRLDQSHKHHGYKSRSEVGYPEASGTPTVIPKPFHHLQSTNKECVGILCNWLNDFSSNNIPDPQHHSGHSACTPDCTPNSLPKCTVYQQQ